MNAIQTPQINRTAVQPLAAVMRFMTELTVLFRIQLSIIRQSWVVICLVSSAFPFTTLMFMKFFSVDPSPEMIVRTIAGNMIFGVIIMGLNGMGTDISWQKHQGHFTFYASLPISQISFVLACLMRGFLSSAPTFVIMAGVGQFVYGVSFHYSWVLIPVFVLSIFSIAGIGVLVGFWSPAPEMTSMLVQVLMMLISFMTPVMVEMSQLPVVLQWFSYLVPTTYAAAALRESLTIGWTAAVTYNMLFLLGYTLVSLILITRVVNWRVEK